MRVILNLNAYVWVTLNDRGRAAIRRHFEGVFGPSFEETLKDYFKGWGAGGPVRMQFWQLIEYLGPHFGPGASTPCDMDVEIEKSSLNPPER